MFMASSTFEWDLLVVDALYPFLILEFQDYGFWECPRNIHLYADPCIGGISPF
jgi:hypothetical protein